MSRTHNIVEPAPAAVVPDADIFDADAAVDLLATETSLRDGEFVIDYKDDGDWDEPTGSARDKRDAELQRTQDLMRAYLHDIGRTALLTAEQEVELSKEIEAGLLAARIRQAREISQEEVNAFARARWAKLPRVPRPRGGSRQDTVAGRSGLYPSAEAYQEQVAAVEAELAEPRAISDRHGVTQAELEQLIADGKNAKDHMIRANLRLVVSIAKRYTGRGMPQLDLIQEGNLGLVRAVEKFDYTKGFKFSTYATWWIRQAIGRALNDQARTIRIPIHMMEDISRVNRIAKELGVELGREPSHAELAEATGMSREEIRLTMEADKMVPISLDYGLDTDGQSVNGQPEHTLGDMVAVDPQEVEAVVEERDARTRIGAAITSVLTEREAAVIRLRFGLNDERVHTLVELEPVFGVTRERIRQIEDEALQKLKHPNARNLLQGLL